MRRRHLGHFQHRRQKLFFMLVHTFDFAVLDGFFLQQGQHGNFPISFELLHHAAFSSLAGTIGAVWLFHR